MTKYTVTWHDDAKEQLAAVWVERIDRDAITHAANSIDAELRFDPDVKGTPQPDGLRSLLVPPLQVLFAVHTDDRVAEVVLVRYLAASPLVPGSNGHDPLNGVGP